MSKETFCEGDLVTWNNDDKYLARQIPTQIEIYGKGPFVITGVEKIYDRIGDCQLVIIEGKNGLIHHSPGNIARFNSDRFKKVETP